jgi:LssY C-terminus
MHSKGFLTRLARALAVMSAFVFLNRTGSLWAVVSPGDYNFTVTTEQAWTDTGLDLQTGEVVRITAGISACRPQAAGETAPDDNLPLPSAPAGSLIARLHAQGAAPLPVGTNKEITIEEPSHLYLGVNGTSCAASFAVKVHLTPAKTSSAASATSESLSSSTAQPPDAGTQSSDSTAPTDIKSKLASAAQIWLAGQFGTGTQSQNQDSPATSIPGNDAVPGSNPGAAGTVPALSVSSAPLDVALRRELNSLPRRVNDQFHNPGDMVNFVLIGSEQQVQKALDAAGWHQADTDDRTAVLNAVLQTMDKKDYLAMPMSTLYLFGRRQDFGYEMAEPYAMVASRHHFRLWKAPFTWNGQTVWVGAGTHDIGFEKDQRNGKVTHKIDPAVDGERENIGSCLQKSSKTTRMAYYLPPDPVLDARNATGGGYHSDGRLLVVFLQ